jgi:hypothetical protein
LYENIPDYCKQGNNLKIFGDKKTYKTKTSANFIYKNRKSDIEHRKISNKKEHTCLVCAELNRNRR